MPICFGAVLQLFSMGCTFKGFAPDGFRFRLGDATHLLDAEFWQGA